MSASANMKVIEFDQIEIPAHVGVHDADTQRRRLMMLMVPVEPDGGHQGGIGYVVRARNAAGESFALKRLHLGARADAPSQWAAKVEVLLQQEYEAHRLVCTTGRVPQLYGYAHSDGEPAILMEWLEGQTLEDALPLMEAAGGRVEVDTVADFALSCLDALADIHAAGLVHRDISPSNIFICTQAKSLQEQMGDGHFDIRLIDFGSAAADAESAGSFTAAEHLRRGATPDYAAPEMLAHDAANLSELRESPAVDTYALCSVLYRMYTGHVTHPESERGEAAAYRAKVDCGVPSVEAREPDDGTFANVLQQGLSVQQQDRPSVATLFDAICAWEAESGVGRWHATCRRVGSNAGIAAASRTVPTVPRPRAHLAVASKEAGGRVAATIQGIGDARAGKRMLSRRMFIGGCVLVAAVAAAGASIASRPAARGTAEFYEGMHLFRVKDAQTQLWGFVNASGKWVVEPTYAGVTGNFSYETQVGKGGLPLAFAQDGEDGLIGFVSPLDSPGAPTISYKFAGAGLFFNGYAAVLDKDSGLWGFIDSRGEYAVSPMYERVHAVGTCRDGQVAGVKKPGGAWNYIAISGDATLTDAPGELLDRDVACAGVASQGLAPLALEDENHCGFIYADGDDAWNLGTWAVQPKFHDVQAFSNGYAAVSLDGELWGYCRAEDGALAIEPRFAAAREFTSLGLAAVQDARSGLWGFIDEAGEWAAPGAAAKFAELGNLEIGDGGATRRGLAAAKDPESDLWGFVGEDSSWVINPTFADAGVAAGAGMPATDTVS